MDVSDVYNVFTGQEPHEFIIRRRQGVTVYFSSPSRETIVKVDERYIHAFPFIYMTIRWFDLQKAN